MLCGCAQETASEKAALFAEAADVLVAAGADLSTAAKAYFVPGRVEVMGKHTDYAGGRSLLAAISKAFCVVTVDREDEMCRFFSTAKPGDDVTLPMSATLEPKQGGHWTNYPATALRRLSANFPGLKGVDCSIACDIPAASGMSTSSAIICAVFLAVNGRNNLRARPEFKANISSEEELWEYLGCNENGQSFNGLVGDKGVGTFGGSEDHTAIMSCTAGKLNLFSYCPTRSEGVVTWPKGVKFVIGVSGQVAEKTGDKMADYNDASLLAKEAAKVYCTATGVVRTLCGLSFPGLLLVILSAICGAHCCRATLMVCGRVQAPTIHISLPCAPLCQTMRSRSAQRSRSTSPAGARLPSLKSSCWYASTSFLLSQRSWSSRSQLRSVRLTGRHSRVRNQSINQPINQSHMHWPGSEPNHGVCHVRPLDVRLADPAAGVWCMRDATTHTYVTDRQRRSSAPRSLRQPICRIK